MTGGLSQPRGGGASCGATSGAGGGGGRADPSTGVEPVAVPAQRYLAAPDLAVVTSYFNSHNYASKRQRLRAVQALDGALGRSPVHRRVRVRPGAFRAGGLELGVPVSLRRCHVAEGTAAQPDDRSRAGPLHEDRLGRRGHPVHQSQLDRRDVRPARRDSRGPAVLPRRAPAPWGDERLRGAASVGEGSASLARRSPRCRDCGTTSTATRVSPGRPTAGCCRISACMTRPSPGRPTT